MKYAIEIALNRIIPKEIKSIIATQRTLDILIDGVTENFVVIPMDEMLEVYKEQENLFDYDVIPFAILMMIIYVYIIRIMEFQLFIGVQKEH